MDASIVLFLIHMTNSTTVLRFQFLRVIIPLKDHNLNMSPIMCDIKEVVVCNQYRLC